MRILRTLPIALGMSAIACREPSTASHPNVSVSLPRPIPSLVADAGPNTAAPRATPSEYAAEWPMNARCVLESPARDRLGDPEPRLEVHLGVDKADHAFIPIVGREHKGALRLAVPAEEDKLAVAHLESDTMIVQAYVVERSALVYAAKPLIFAGIYSVAPTTALRLGHAAGAGVRVQTPLPGVAPEPVTVATCEDIAMSPGAFDVESTVPKGGPYVRIAKGPLSIRRDAAPGTTIDEVALRLDEEVFANVIDVQGAWTRVRYPHADGIIFGWVPTARVVKTTSVSSRHGVAGGRGGIEDDMTRYDLVCEHALPLFVANDSRRQIHARVKPGVPFRRGEERAGRVEILVPRSPVRLSERWATEPTELERCKPR